jgi:hypothetical protein
MKPTVKSFTGKYLSDAFPIQNDLQQDILSLLLFNFTSEYGIRKLQENHEGVEMNETHHLLIYVVDANSFGLKHKYHKGNIISIRC